MAAAWSGLRDGSKGQNATGELPNAVEGLVTLVLMLCSLKNGHFNLHTPPHNMPWDTVRVTLPLLSLSLCVLHRFASLSTASSITLCAGRLVDGPCRHGSNRGLHARHQRWSSRGDQRTKKGCSCRAPAAIERRSPPHCISSSALLLLLCSASPLSVCCSLCSPLCIGLLP